MTNHFGDARAEFTAAKTGAAVFDLTGRTQLVLSGNDRAKFLHSFCTNDIKRLTPGDGCEAFVTSVQGKVLGHVFVFATHSSLLLDSVPGAAARLLPHLEKYHINEDIELRDVTAQSCVLYVSGPEAPARLTSLGVSGLDALAPFQHRPELQLGVELFVRRVDYFETPGWQLVAPIEFRETLWPKLTEAGLRPTGSEAFEALRIEAGFPWYGIDFTDANLAQEVARTKLAISFTKGCYLGQEPIARIDALGHVNQELRRLKLAGLPVPPAGSEVLSAEGSPAGRVTSSALSFSDDLPVAIAMLRRNVTAPGTAVTVRVGDQTVAGVVV